ncbi:MAG TPA: hypothetical protein VFX50_11980 [Gemmatimonadales bacterium]|nr:hypothetical protein [Gemmatimonadales bacterium]
MAAAPALETDAAQVVEAFLDGTLDPDHWTHAAHLAVGLRLVRRLPFESAVTAMREGILAFLARRGPSTGTGYNATITRFYLHLIAAWDAAHPSTGDFAADVARLVADVGPRHLPAQFYSAGRLGSPEAVTGWVEPDLRPLPPLAGALRSVA